VGRVSCDLDEVAPAQAPGIQHVNHQGGGRPLSALPLLVTNQRVRLAHVYVRPPVIIPPPRVAPPRATQHTTFHHPSIST